MNYIDTFETLQTKLKYNINVKVQKCSLLFFFSFLIISGDEEFLNVYNSKIGGGIES